MPLMDALAILWRKYRAAVLWGKSCRKYSRAIKHIERGLTLKEKGDRFRAWAEAIEKQNGDTVGAAETVRGQWLKGEFDGEYICSRCGMEYCEADPTVKPYKYCPACGSENE